MSLFIDTSGFYALLVGTERDHQAVLDAFRTAAERGRRMVTTNYVLVETTALLQHRIGLPPVRDLEERILPLVTVHWVSSELHRRAVERLFRTDKRRVSLVDAMSFIVMDAEGLSDVLGLDPDFATEGFRLLPDAVR
jgi:predicted nucleic acid-binding protein